MAALHKVGQQTLTDQELINKFGIKSTDKILDIGGSAKQHDLLPIDTLVDLLQPEDDPYNRSYLKAKYFIKCDITKEKLPFKDNQFEFVLCTHTLEDIYNPFLVIEEMSRVAKRGYIAAPSRGKDSEFSHLDLTDWLTGPRRQPGYAHHKWFFELKNDLMQISVKHYPLLYTAEFMIGKWRGGDEFQYYWEDFIKYEFLDSTDMHTLIENYRQFMKENKKWIKKSWVLIYIDNPYYFIKELAKMMLKRGMGYKKQKSWH